MHLILDYERRGGELTDLEMGMYAEIAILEAAILTIINFFGALEANKIVRRNYRESPRGIIEDEIDKFFK